MKKTTTFGIAIAMGVLTFCGCQSAQKTASIQNSPLLNTHWELVSLEGKTINPETEKKPFITFNEDGSFNGNLGCNLFFGTYYQNKQKLELNHSGATKMLCGHMETEDAFLQSLKKKVTKYEINGKTLTLYSKNEVLFVFEDKTDSIKAAASEE